MAGPFDFMNDDQVMLGLSLLSAAGPSATPQSPFQRIYGGLLDFQQNKARQEDRAFNKRYREAQMSNIESEIAARGLAAEKEQRKQDMVARILGGPQSAQGALTQGASVGDIGPTRTNAARMADARMGMPTRQGGGIANLTPEQLFGLKMAGVDATEIWKQLQPDMAVTDGYAYDKRRLPPGFVPGVSTSSNGQTSLRMPDGRGGVTISAPPGAANTFGTYQNIEQQARADWDPLTVTPAGQAPQMTTRGGMVRQLGGSAPTQGAASAAPGPMPGYGARIPAATQAARDGERGQILQGELAKAQAAYDTAVRASDFTAAARHKADVDALGREIGGARATVGMPLETEADKLRQAEAVKAEAERNKARAEQTRKSDDMLGNLMRAETLLKQGPTDSRVGSWVDSGLGAVGISTKSAQDASGLEAISGWLVSNVPRMEGPQSNLDVENYKTMAGRVGDRTLPVPERLAALNEVKRLVQKYASTGGATGDFGSSEKPAAQQSFSMLPAAKSFSGRRVQGPDGTVYRSNGTTWVKE